MKLSRNLESGEPRHRDVEDREIELGAESDLERLLAVAGLGDHLQVRLGIQDQLQAASDELVVVGEEDA